LLIKYINNVIMNSAINRYTLVLEKIEQLVKKHIIGGPHKHVIDYLIDSGFTSINNIQKSIPQDISQYIKKSDYIDDVLIFPYFISDGINKGKQATTTFYPRVIHDNLDNEPILSGAYEMEIINTPPISDTIVKDGETVSIIGYFVYRLDNYMRNGILIITHVQKFEVWSKIYVSTY
jgi:hypothetical protein